MPQLFWLKNSSRPLHMTQFSGFSCATVLLSSLDVLHILAGYFSSKTHVCDCRCEPDWTALTGITDLCVPCPEAVDCPASSSCLLPCALAALGFCLTGYVIGYLHARRTLSSAPISTATQRRPLSPTAPAAGLLTTDGLGSPPRWVSRGGSTSRLI